MQTDRQTLKRDNIYIKYRSQYRYDTANYNYVFSVTSVHAKTNHDPNDALISTHTHKHNTRVSWQRTRILSELKLIESRSALVPCCLLKTTKHSFLPFPPCTTPSFSTSLYLSRLLLFSPGRGLRLRIDGPSSETGIQHGCLTDWMPVAMRGLTFKHRTNIGR